MNKLEFEEGEELENKLPTFVQWWRKQVRSRKNIYFIDYAKAFDCVDHKKLWKILKGMDIPDHLNCFVRNLYAGQGATVTTKLGITDWFKIGQGVHQGCIFSPCLFNLCAKYIMWNARLDESQAGIKISGRNVNNLRYTDSVQSLSHVQLFVTPWTAARQASLFINSQSLLNSCQLSWWCHPTISSSAVPFSFCLQSFPAWGFSLMSPFR